MKNAAIVEDGIITNIIVFEDDADEATLAAFGSLPVSDGQSIGDVYLPPASEMERLRADVDYLAALAGVEL